MYTEKQHYQHQYMGRLQWISSAVVLWQLSAFAATEAGIPWLPFGHKIHLFLLITAASVWLLLANGHLLLKVSTAGWDLRFFPFQFFFRHIDWEEIKHVRLISRQDLPLNASFGYPGKDFTRSYLLTNFHYQVLRIDLITGGQVFVSTKQPEELLKFLRKGVFECLSF